MSRKNIFIWCLYDFANSFVFITFLLYFSRWMVVSRGFPDFWYNATYIIGSLGLIFFAPYLGNKADLYNRGRRYLTLSTFSAFLFYALAALTAIFGTKILWSALAFGLGNFFYQLSFIFYNPLLNNIAPAEKRGRISGLGFFLNYLGQIAGIAVSLPFLSGKISLGVDPQIASILPAVFIFGLLALPLILSKGIFSRGPDYKPREENMDPIKLIKVAASFPGVLYFLIAFFLFSDALTTLINNFSIITSNLFGASSGQISVMIILVITSTAIGAFVWGWLSDKLGARRIMTANLVGWAIIIPILAWIATTYQTFFTAAVISGLFLGGSWSVSRQVLIELVPENFLNYSFGIYAISERAATVVGPLAWSLAVAFFGYRPAIFTMTFFLIAAVIFMIRVNKIKRV